MKTLIEKKKYNRIKEVLDARKVDGEHKTQYWLAKSTGITYASITSYYHGKSEPTLKNLFKIAQQLKVNPKELINS